MPRAPLYKGRPVTALLVTVGAVLVAAYAALAPTPVDTQPARLILESPPAAHGPDFTTHTVVRSERSARSSP